MCMCMCVCVCARMHARKLKVQTGPKQTDQPCITCSHVYTQMYILAQGGWGVGEGRRYKLRVTVREHTFRLTDQNSDWTTNSHPLCPNMLRGEGGGGGQIPTNCKSETLLQGRVTKEVHLFFVLSYILCDAYSFWTCDCWGREIALQCLLLFTRTTI